MSKERELASFRKLLSSHLSIYNALTNPDLDEALPQLGKDRFPTPPPQLDIPAAVLADPYASLSPWQLVNLKSDSIVDIAVLLRLLPFPASPRPPSTSVLSSTSDDDESMVMVPSFKNRASNVMVFETDEEDLDHNDLPDKIVAFSHDLDDDRTLTSTSAVAKHVATPASLHTSFIMPKMSLSVDVAHLLLVIVTSLNDTLARETADLVAFVQRNCDGVYVSHLALAAPPLQLDVSVARNCSLLFLVNDGSLVFGDLMAAVARGAADTPKLTVINVMTSNYFVNLLDIINHVKPHQIWKSPSLKNDRLLDKMKAFLDEELALATETGFAKELHAKKQKFKNKAARRKARSVSPRNSMYDSLIPTTNKPDYKNLERQIRSEMLMSLSYSNIDPLLLSSNLSHMKALLNAVARYFGSTSPDDSGKVSSMLLQGKFWLIFSFSIGLGIGVTFASSAVTVWTARSYDKLKGICNMQRSVVLVVTPENSGAFATTDVMERASQIWEAYIDHATRVCSNYCDQVVSSIHHSHIARSVVEYCSSVFSDLRSFAAYALQSAFSGYEKTTRLVMDLIS